MDTLMNLYNHDKYNNIVKSERQTTGRRITDEQIEHLKNVRLRVEEIKNWKKNKE
jgi:hypothetical protein